MNFIFKKYWMIVSLLIIVNIFIFVIFSNKLESYVYEKMTSSSYLQT